MSNLNQRISEFYDQSTDLWLDMWGEHMHHGYYAPGQKPDNHQAAQIDLIDRLLEWGQVVNPLRILDAGCGVGGSARHLARRYGSEVLGVNLSKVQIDRARQFTTKANLTEQVAFQQRDLLSLDPQKDGPFDLIWSMENAEHIAPKKDMLRLFSQLLAPNGQILMATWCLRDDPPPSPREEKWLRQLYRIYHLPPMISLARYQDLAKSLDLQNVQTADWSEAVAPFWGAVIRSALTTRGLRGLLRAGWPTLQGAWAMTYMRRGYRTGLIRFGLLQARKP